MKDKILKRTIKKENKNYEQAISKYEIIEIIDALNNNVEGDKNLFIKLNKAHFIFDVNERVFYEFNGVNWKKDAFNEIKATGMKRLIDYYKSFKKNMWKYLEIAGYTEAGKDIAKLLEQRIKNLQAKNRKVAVIEAACEGKNSLSVDSSCWNKNPETLACDNGVINLRTGILTLGHSESFINIASPTQFNGLNEPCPTWLTLLDTLFENDKKIISFLQRLLGYTVTGYNRENIFVCFSGSGQNGKGTLLKTVAHILGDYACDIRTDVLLDKYSNSDGPTPGLMRMKNKRMITASESAENNKFDTSFIKRLSGGDKIVGRRLHSAEEEFSTNLVLYLLTNYVPKFPFDDDALWHRIIHIPFNLSFVSNPKLSHERHKDVELQKRLYQESSGILSWLVKGAMEYLNKGLCIPEKIHNNKKVYRDSLNNIDSFIAECCKTDSSYAEKAKTLYDEYCQWCAQCNEDAHSVKRFGNHLKKSFQKKRTSNGNKYVGLRLT